MVCLSVTLYVCPFVIIRAMQKRLKQSRCQLEGSLVWAQGTMYQMGSRYPKGEGQLSSPLQSIESHC